MLNTITTLVRETKFEKISEVKAEFFEACERTETLIDQNKKVLKTKASNFLGRVNGMRAKLDGILIAIEAIESLTPLDGPSELDLAPAPASDTPSRPAGENISLFKMESMKLPKFNGELKQWRSFHEQFTSIIENSAYPDIQKHVFLHNHLTGSAKRAIEGYEISAANYKVCWKILEERYGDPTKLVAVYYRELENLEKREDAEGQRSNLDTIRKLFNNLSITGVKIDQDYLKTIVMGKFSKITLRAVLRELVKKPTDKFSVDQLIDSLSAVISTDELVDSFLAEAGETPARKFSKPKFAAALVGGAVRCVFCSGSHRSQDCRRFRSLKARREQLDSRRICYACLKPGHFASTCSSRQTQCNNCKRPGHPIALCVNYIVAQNRDKNSTEPQAGPSGYVNRQQQNRSRPIQFKNNRKPEPKGTFLETFSCLVKLRNSNYFPIRGVVDSCSQFSYITLDLAKRIGGPIENRTKLNLCLFGTLETIKIDSGEISVTLQNRNHKNEKTMNFLITEHITGNMLTSPPPEIVSQVLPSHLTWADPEIFINSVKPIEIIIGNNYQFNFITGDIKRLSATLVLRHSFFGWIPSGSIKETLAISDAVNSSTLLSSNLAEPQNLNEVKFVKENFSLQNELIKLWSLEILGIKLSEQDDIESSVLENFRNTVRFEDDRYVVRWPWKQEHPALPTNFRMCMARLKSLFSRSPLEFIKKYEKVLLEQLELGIIEYAPKTTPYPIHYLPHRGIDKNQKLRIVYDASAKTKSNSSLNDLIHSGPVLLEDLVGLILNFRLHPIALTADIEKAFLQVGLNEVDRDAVRFLWVKDITKPPASDNLVVFRFTRVPFGVVASPFLLNMVLQELLTSETKNENFELAKKRFYVDNLVISLKNVTSALNMYSSLNKKLASASFNLRDWTSNDPDFIRAIGKPPLSPEDKKISILGVNWNRFSDTLSIKFDPLENTATVTKRLALKFYASIFDPIGVFGPSTLRLKLFIQDCWRDKFDWDTPLPSNFVARWLKIYSEALVILNLEIPRLYWPHVDAGTISLHIFCDASKDAYACAAYLTYVNTSLGVNTASLIFAKTRAAPKNQSKKLNNEPVYAGTPATPVTYRELSIPRLELMAVLIGKRVATFLSSKLDLTLESTVLWTDATTILQWLNSSAIQPKFVQNRLNEIRKTPNIVIRHVPTDANPADIASRGVKPSLLRNNDLWWKGPPWLAHENLWPPTPDTTSIYVSPTVVLVTGVAAYRGYLTDNLEKRFSRWNAYVRIFGHIAYFVEYQTHRIDRTSPPSAAEKYQKGERLLIREIQRKYLGNELNLLLKGLQPNNQLDLYLDDNDLIRCNGRIENSRLPLDTVHPFLLPRHGPLIELLIRQIHEENCHIGCTHLVSKLRDKFWIPQIRPKIKSIINRCVVCRKWEGGTFRLPPMPQLPAVRVVETPSFQHTGVDFLGPLYITNDQNEDCKVYIALFVCLVTRAVHLEIARNLTGCEFLQCLSRFADRRGTPRFIISDNATNFVFVQPLVGIKVKISEYKLEQYLSSNNIEWHFIPTYSPWQGGVYERLVALVKSALKKSYGTANLDYVELSTAICKIENIINDRPLTYLPANEVIGALTPNNILKRRALNASTTVEVTERPLPSNTENLILAWRNIITVVDSFWDNFRNFYLKALRESQTSEHRHARGSVPRVPSVNEIVLVKDASAPRADWKLGLVLEVDRRQSLAHLRCNGKIILRSINLLYPLECPPSGPITVLREPIRKRPRLAD